MNPPVRVSPTLVGRRLHIIITSALGGDHMTTLGALAEQHGCVEPRGRCRYCPIEGYRGSLRRGKLTPGHLFLHVLARVAHHARLGSEPHILATACIEKRQNQETVILPASVVAQPAIQLSIQKIAELDEATYG